MREYRNSRNRKKYAHMREVPQNELNEWLRHHCFTCGTPLTEVERKWRRENEKAAEEASVEELEFWTEHYRTGGYEEAKDLIRQGFKNRWSPVLTIQEGEDAWGYVEEPYFMCTECFDRMLDAMMGEKTPKEFKDVASVILPN